MTIALEHEELTGKIRQAAYDTHCYFGNGFLEKVYENAMRHRLCKLGLDVTQQSPIWVSDIDGTVVGEYVADLLVDKVIIIEVKAVKALTEIHQAQVLHYLKATGYSLGLLINFGTEKLEFKRLIQTGQHP